MSNKYRQSVAAVVLNSHDEVLVAKPPDNEAMKDINWQLPQGGIDEGETTEEALFREIEEELGVRRDQLEIIKKSKSRYVYSWPEEVIKCRGLCGQEQVYFLLRYNGSDTDIKLDKKEFTAWKWVNAAEAVRLQNGGLREKVYPKVFEEFKLL